MIQNKLNCNMRMENHLTDLVDKFLKKFHRNSYMYNSIFQIIVIDESQEQRQKNEKNEMHRMAQ